MTTVRPTLRTTIVGTVAVVVLAATAALALVAFGVVRSGASSLRDVEYADQRLQASNTAAVERVVAVTVADYARTHPADATAGGLTRYLHTVQHLDFMTVLDPKDAADPCRGFPCWATLPGEAQRRLSLGKPYEAGDRLDGSEETTFTVTTPLGEAVGDGHLALAVQTSTYGTIPGVRTFWYRTSIVIGAGVALAVLAGLVVAFSVRRPLRLVSTAARRFGEGDLTAHAPERGSEELAALGAVFNTMAGRLRRTLDELHASQDVQRRFVADVSHELRTPLSTMLASLGAMNGPSTVDRQRSVELLSMQTYRLAGLVDDLLEISRFDAGQAELSREVVDLGDLVRDAAGTVAPDLPIEITVVGGPLWSVDPRRMHTVARNLIANAVRHGLPPVRVVIDSTRGGVLRLEVIDDGPGIDLARSARIFGRFTQLDDSRSGGNNGSGLGLAIARENVLLHGGTIEVSAGPPTRFTVTLPQPPR